MTVGRPLSRGPDGSPRSCPALACLLITAVAVAVQALEERAMGHPFVEALAAAILIGILVRTAKEGD